MMSAAHALTGICPNSWLRTHAASQMDGWWPTFSAGA